MWSKPAATYSFTDSTYGPASGPSANCPRTSSARTVFDAASKFTGLGSSLITFQPVRAQRVVRSTSSIPASSVVAQAIGTSAYRGPAPPAPV
jgi:hypothetical protein